MPPKRKTPAVAATPSKAIESTPTSTRSKRASILPATEEPTPKKARTATKAKSRATADSSIAVATKKRGRPAREQADAIIEEVADGAQVIDDEPMEHAKETTKKRGRPGKKTAETAEQKTEAAEPAPKKGRGRPSNGKADMPAKESEEVEKAPAKRRRAKKATVAETKDEVDDEPPAVAVKGKRGRPSKATAREPAEQEEVVPSVKKARGKAGKAAVAPEPSAEEDSAPPAKKARGKAAKAAAAATDETVEPAAKKERGRPAKAVEEPSAEEEDAAPKKGRASKAAAPKPQAEIDEAPAKKGRGRPGKKPAEPEPISTSRHPRDKTEEPPPKKRGRQARKADLDVMMEEEEVEAAATKPRSQANPARDEEAVDAQIEEELAEAASVPPAGPVGRKRKAPAATGKGKGKKAKQDATSDEVDTSNEVNPTEATTEIAGDADVEGRQYWLMKAEPASRIEKTESGKEVDVQFSIDDLRGKTEPEPWEGIRNLQAQKNLRTMNVGDLAFFYESNIKVPGIIGTMEIVQEASPDQTAFSTDSPYYDAKSNPSKPKWQLVHVAFQRKFGKKITLKELQAFAKSGGALENMQMIKSTRLSVSKVSPAEWRFIMKQVEGEDDDAAKAIEDDRGADFASAFEIPSALSKATAAIGSTVQNTAEEAVGISHDLLGNGLSIPDTVDAINETPMPSIEAPTNDDAAPDTNGSGGFIDALKSVVGLGPKRSSSRPLSAKPASRAGSVRASSRAPSRAGSRAPSRAGSRKPASRAGSAVPASQPEKGVSLFSESIMEEEDEIVNIEKTDLDIEMIG